MNTIKKRIRTIKSIDKIISDRVLRAIKIKSRIKAFHEYSLYMRFCKSVKNKDLGEGLVNYFKTIHAYFKFKDYKDKDYRDKLKMREKNLANKVLDAIQRGHGFEEAYRQYSIHINGLMKTCLGDKYAPNEKIVEQACSLRNGEQEFGEAAAHLSC